MIDKYIKNKFVKLGLYGMIGGLIGYAYYYYVGCSNGCPLSSNWYITTGYGFASGLLLGMPQKKKREDSGKEQAKN
ncbi:MAG TPA: DUF6132 family protein [Ignavibacteria bacterium]|nr:DUF6132 family protein [Ignavibacteria bacterium]HRF67411.1 DUF6132 family protein [Ignavibacteria bacterium]HRJ03108.1 DUF6132 family protein [Ignavibacteria bacterium]HRJ85666.1 DUF6132 family protein [Ignavibacteria bacterium]